MQKIKYILILFVLLLAVNIFAQQKLSFAIIDSTSNSLFETKKWKELINIGKKANQQKIDFFDLDKRMGTAYYERNIYPMSLHYFEKAYKIYSTPELTEDIYYSLLFSGFDLEAMSFRIKHPSTSSIAYKKGIKELNIDIGDRVSTNQSIAGDMFYVDFGWLSKPNPIVNIFQNIIYLQQYNPSGNYKQLEYFISVEKYLGKGWYIKPSIHYALTIYNNSSQDTLPYYNTNTQPLSPPFFGTYTTHINGETIYFTAIPGTIHSNNVGALFSKRLGAFSIGLEPSFQYLYNSITFNTEYKFKGNYDSFVNNFRVLAEPLIDSGNFSSKKDSIVSIGQFGGMISYLFTLNGFPIYSKLACYYLTNFNGVHSMGYNLYVFLKIKNKLWIHCNFITKGSLPWASNIDGQYFNTYVELNYKSGLTLQFKPLKKLSPMITLQTEQDQLNNGLVNKKNNFNSVYLTLKYNL